MIKQMMVWMDGSDHWGMTICGCLPKLVVLQITVPWWVSGCAQPDVSVIVIVMRFA